MSECFVGGAGAITKEGTVTTTATLMQTLSIDGFNTVPNNFVAILTAGKPQDSNYRQSVEYATIKEGVVSLYCRNNGFDITKRTGTASITGGKLVITTPYDYFSTEVNNTYKWWSL